MHVASSTTDRSAAEFAAPRKVPARLSALDFTKGALVLIMVLYHWLNFFVKMDVSYYRYLRFLTPSFIFITGFLISNVYASKFRTSDPQVPRRLLKRGTKLLAIAMVLNLAVGAFHLKSTDLQPASSAGGRTAVDFLAGSGPAAFSVLVPIAYLLVLSAGLLLVCRFSAPVFHTASALLVLAALILEWNHVQSGYLPLMGVGMLGVSVGYIPIDKINAFVKHPAILWVAYLAYLGAIATWNVIYPLQILGVSLSLAILYQLGGQQWLGRRFNEIAIRLGKYSLFAYIIQIVILRLLQRSLRPFGSGFIVTAAALLAGAALTIASVEVMDRSRLRAPAVKKIYNAVFA